MFGNRIVIGGALGLSLLGTIGTVSGASSATTHAVSTDVLLRKALKKSKNTAFVHIKDEAPRNLDTDFNRARERAASAVTALEKWVTDPMLAALLSADGYEIQLSSNIIYHPWAWSTGGGYNVEIYDVRLRAGPGHSQGEVVQTIPTPIYNLHRVSDFEHLNQVGVPSADWLIEHHPQLDGDAVETAVRTYVLDVLGDPLDETAAGSDITEKDSRVRPRTDEKSTLVRKISQ